MKWGELGIFLEKERILGRAGILGRGGFGPGQGAEEDLQATASHTLGILHAP